MSSSETLVSSLRGRLQELQARQGRVDGHRMRLELPADSQDQAQALGNEEVMDHIDERYRAEIRELETALQRAEAGIYGRCSSCGEEIDAARLAALPTTHSCRDCA
jgi:DnaK suppressor protein